MIRRPYFLYINLKYHPFSYAYKEKKKCPQPPLKAAF